jgi:hypothetical protein
MERVRFTQALFAISSASLAILSLTYDDSAQVGLSLPEWIPLRHACIDGAALLLLVASAGLCFSRSALASALRLALCLRPLHSRHGAQLATRPPGIRLPHRTCPRCGRIWHPRRRPPPPGSHLFATPRPSWATPPQNQWSELVVNLVLAAAAWIVVTSWADRPPGQKQRQRSANPTTKLNWWR